MGDIHHMNWQWIDCGDGKHILRDLDAACTPRADKSDARMRARREGVKDWSLPKKGQDPENPAPHYDRDNFAVFSTDTERTEWLARSQDTSRPYFREDK